MVDRNEIVLEDFLSNGSNRDEIETWDVVRELKVC